MTVEQFLTNILFTDNIEIQEDGTNKILFNLVRHYGRVTPADIPEHLRKRTFDSINGSNKPNKLRIFVK